MIYSYLLLIFLSPYLMRLFNPLNNLRWVLIIHNFTCSVLSLYCVIVSVIGIWQTGGIFTLTKSSPLLHHAFFVYWMSKFIELMDTVYMILRHKHRQISFLHVFHHSSITILADVGYNTYPWPPVAMVTGLNSTVHVVMYGYYCVTAIYPLHVITWKRRITQLQIAQFLFAIWFGATGYCYHGFCIYSILYPIAMLALFSNFYYNAFVRKKMTSSGDQVAANGTKQD